MSTKPIMPEDPLVSSPDSATFESIVQENARLRRTGEVLRHHLLQVQDRAGWRHGRASANGPLENDARAAYALTAPGSRQVMAQLAPSFSIEDFVTCCERNDISTLLAYRDLQILIQHGLVQRKGELYLLKAPTE